VSGTCECLMHLLLQIVSDYVVDKLCPLLLEIQHLASAALDAVVRILAILLGGM
jgi:hypothetical protein